MSCHNKKCNGCHSSCYCHVIARVDDNGNLLITVNGFEQNAGSVTGPAGTTISTVTKSSGVITHDNGAGTVVTWKEGWTDVSEIEGIVTFTYPDGATAQVDLKHDQLEDNGDGTYTWTNADGSTFTLDNGGGNTSTLVDNGDGTFTHNNGAGSTTTFNAGWTEVSEAAGVVTFTYPDGATAQVDLKHDQLEDNGDGTYTWTNADGSTFSFGGGGGNTSTLVDNGDGTFTHNNGAGSTTTFNAGWTEVSEDINGNTRFAYPDGTIETIENCCDQLEDNGDGTYTWTNADGSIFSFGGGGGNTSTLVDNGDGTFTHNNGAGVSVDISFSADDITDFDTTSNPPALGTLLSWDGSSWVPQRLSDIFCQLLATAQPLPNDGSSYYVWGTDAEGACVLYEAEICDCAEASVCTPPVATGFSIGDTNGAGTANLAHDSIYVCIEMSKEISGTGGTQDSAAENNSSVLYLVGQTGEYVDGTWPASPTNSPAVYCFTPDTGFQPGYSYTVGVPAGAVAADDPDCVVETTTEQTFWTAPIPNNIVQNGGFDSDLTSWNSLNASLANPAGGASGTAKYVEVTAAGGGIPQLFQTGLNVSTGEQRQVGFWHKGVAIEARLLDSSFTNMGLTYSVPASDDWTYYTPSFESTGTDANSRLQFIIPSGYSAGDTYSIDEVVFGDA